MTRESLNRRELLKFLGAGGSAVAADMLAPRIVGATSRGYVVESPDDYGGFLVETLEAGNDPYTYDPEKLKRFSEKNTVFSRNVWDPARREELAKNRNWVQEHVIDPQGKDPLHSRLGLAWWIGAWGVASNFSQAYSWEARSSRIRGKGLSRLGAWKPEEMGMTWNDVARIIKHAGMMYGASGVGICEAKDLWFYADRFAGAVEEADGLGGPGAGGLPVVRDTDRFEKAKDGTYLPRSFNRAIVMTFEEDYDSVMTSPNRICVGASGNGYSKMAGTSHCLSEFIRALGWRAAPAGNDLALSVPLAIDAGLGQLGRNGGLVTTKFGPRVRIAKVFVEMPLPVDAPINFGVTEFCDNCEACAEKCPSGAVPTGPRTWEGKTPSNNPGALKWYVNVDKCYDFNDFACQACKASCPFNKPNNSWVHKLTRQFVEGRIGTADKVMLKMDQASGYGKQMPEADFWKQDGSRTVTARGL